MPKDDKAKQLGIDRESMLKKTKPEMLAAMMDEVADLDLRRQAQIRNQVAAINRTMAGATYDDEMARLHEELASVQTQLAAAQQEIRQLRGEPTPTAFNLGSRRAR